MSGYLLDTSVLSELAPGRNRPLSGLSDWIEANSSRLFLSVVSAAELEQGIEKLRYEGAVQRSTALAEWLDEVLQDFAANLVEVDRALARAAGKLSAIARRQGKDPGFADIVIAATARERNLVLLTRNVRHFAHLDVKWANPFDRLP